MKITLWLMMVTILALPPVRAAAAPAARPWTRWEAHDPASKVVVDHGAWSGFLGRYLVPSRNGGATRVAYAEVTATDRAILAEYLAGLQKVRVSGLKRAEQLAFWINLYNAATVRLVLDHYPVASIRDIRPGGLFSSGPWDAPILSVEGERLTLNDIEHRILRPVWRDPRVHYAINCASLGCPNLPPMAFSVGNLDALLERAARDFVNDARAVSFSSGRLTLSSIYSWFAGDFGGDRESLLGHLRRYAGPELAARIAGYEGPIRYAYDWSLNDR
jgi:hypothetical protein